jgi:hypothetical protein
MPPTVPTKKRDISGADHDWQNIFLGSGVVGGSITKKKKKKKKKKASFFFFLDYPHPSGARTPRTFQILY